MEDFHSRLNEIVEKINYMETNRIRIGKILREINDSLEIGPNEEILDNKIINKIPIATNKKNSVLGIDGGIVKNSYHGLDLILTRAVGVNFIYDGNKLKKVDYFPSSNPQPNPQIVLDSFSDFELNSCFNFIRQLMEIDTTIESIRKMNPDITLLDGSVLPQYVTKSDNPVLKEYYKKLIDKYKELFETSEKNQTILAGVIEDSRGIKFCDILLRRFLPEIKNIHSRELKLVLEKTRDSNLLYYVLEKGERSCIFNYSQNPSIHPLVKEFDKMSNNFFSFYVKTVEFDRPLRVDFFARENQLELANKISNLLIQTSGHSGYGLPAILIEADQRAKLTQKDLDLFYLDLINRIGNISGLFKMRREMRPF
jgi:NurA-like 5'-3' nuclease